MKKEITDDELVRKYKTKEERMNYLTSLNPKQVDIISIKEDLPNIIKKNLREPSKDFINSIKEQSFYQIQCPRCKISNRKWIEEKKNPYFCPISIEEIFTNKGVNVFYNCSNCKNSWRR